MTASIRVKVLSPLPSRYFLHQLPRGAPAWGDCRFSFDTTDRRYDWLVVYEDVPPEPGKQRNSASEPLACHPAHTILVTSEPSSIKHYGHAFTRQFGCVLTSQPEWALPHPERIHSQPGLAWMYGMGRENIRSFDEITEHPPVNKSCTLSMVYSPKRQRHTLHHRRNTFMKQLIERLPGMDVYGRGAQSLADDDKAAALDSYRYHVAVENHTGPHHWTEKLADAFLGMTLPFYYGCPNAADYFPPDSFIPIDIRDVEGTARIIESAIMENAYQQRLPAITEARRRVLYEYNLFIVLAREISRRHRPNTDSAADNWIYSRHALRRRHPLSGMRDIAGKARARMVHLANRD